MGLVWREITLRVLVRRIVGLVWREITLRVLVKAYCGLGVERDNSPCFGKGVLWASCGER